MILKAFIMMTLILITKKSMGNGVIDDITDFIYVEPEKFNNMLTNEMAEEIDMMNEKMLTGKPQICSSGARKMGNKRQIPGNTCCLATDIKCKSYC